MITIPHILPAQQLEAGVWKYYEFAIKKNSVIVALEYSGFNTSMDYYIYVLRGYQDSLTAVLGKNQHNYNTAVGSVDAFPQINLNNLRIRDGKLTIAIFAGQANLINLTLIMEEQF